MTQSTNKSAEEAPVVERDERDRAARQARVTEKTGSALKPPPPGSIPAPPGPVSTGRPARQPAHAAPSTGAEVLPPLLGKSVADGYRKRMRETLANFVDDPGDAVAGADALFGEAITALNQALLRRQEEMARQRQGSSGDTEQLRQALLRYRAAIEAVVTL
ncbi:hypothetical protein [Yinghuangia soli]|uniref:Uncharacterized protein n=1 Tax=Yinghuangia soli TaxID=2908204 RepID=A0AA41PYV7_9ACTN|nr:hypothetical protein [Yinghuangia soli]MCF2528303.1 hypothetical protein [Yinghuangia soli]